jgi:hypothetical protein
LVRLETEPALFQPHYGRHQREFRLRQETGIAQDCVVGLPGYASNFVHWQCHHRTIMSADPWPDDVTVPTFGQRMVCTRCGIIGADARPNWNERPERESLTGVQWR